MPDTEKWTLMTDCMGAFVRNDHCKVVRFCGFGDFWATFLRENGDISSTNLATAELG